MTLRAVVIATMALAALPATAAWYEWPAAPPSDGRLERIVRVAYAAAAQHARANGNYFSRDGDYAALRDAIADALLADSQDVAAIEGPLWEMAAATVCTSGSLELRIVVNVFGDGIGLAAVSADRAFAYSYEPRVDPRVAVIPATECTGR